MKIEDYKKSLNSPLRQRSLLFLIKDKSVLLGMKKKGFGQNKWLGIGGKLEPNESIEEATLRETEEEIGVVPRDIERVATLDFYFPNVDKPDHWSQQVCVFIARKWDGEIRESKEIYPRWFRIDEIPFDSMWKDALHWLPKVLSGNKLTADFLFINDSDVGEVNIHEE